MYSIQISPKSRTLSWNDDLLPPPEPAPDEVRIRIHAAGINRADLTQRDGLYPPPEGAVGTLGLECAGTLDAIGDQVTDYQPGDAVCALLSGGGYAEYVCVPAAQILPIPKGMSFEQAAAIPEVYGTVWQNIFMEAGLKAGEKVLVHAGASGVGTAAIQLCHIFGASVFATLGNSEKADRCRQLGAERCFLRHDGSFLASVRDWAQGSGVDVILDPVGAAYLEDNLALLNNDGRLCLIGALGGMRAEIDLRYVLLKRLRIQGNMLRPRSSSYKQRVMQALLINIWPLFESGRIKPVIDQIYPISESMDAFDRLASNKTLGKLVLKVI